MIRACAAPGLPLLGVCLGHQAIGAAYGGVIERAPELLHGKTSQVHHTGTACSPGCPTRSPPPATTRSTIRPEHLPAELEVTGRTDSGVIMALRHRELPIHGVQFHPESVLTDGGHRMLANWMAEAGHPAAPGPVESLTAEMAELAARA